MMTITDTLGNLSPRWLFTLTFFSILVISRLVYSHFQAHQQPVSHDKQLDYTYVFPPSRRSQLTLIAPKLIDHDATTNLPLTSKKILAMESNYRLANNSKFIFSGFTVGEVKLLGDFPNYAHLSGIPLPTPLPNFNLKTAMPRPYRPFRWPYHQTMAFKKMHTDHWLELENTYRERILQRKALHALHGKKVMQSLPGSELACKELMEMAIQFLCARYPAHFQLLLPENVLVNQILDTEQDLTLVKEPLQVLLDNVPEDFAVMLRDPDTGRYMLRAGVICSALGWNLGQKIGMGLPSLHAPVPGYKKGMGLSVDRFFTKLPASGPIERGSWSLEIGQPLYVDPTASRAHHHVQDQSLKREDINLRVDWQTIRRLPLSGAVIFNYKALFTPITEFESEPQIPTLLLKILDQGTEDILKYKSTWHVSHVVKPSLEEYERRQVEEGLVEKGWDAQTLEEFPFFAGWEKKCTQ